MTHPETLNHVLAKLEPDSGFDGCAHDTAFTPERRAALSLAISARRIADALEGLAGPLNAYGETIGECIQGQHERGLRGIPNP